MKNENDPSILLVDDHPGNLKLLEGILSGMKLNLVLADSGEEALRRLQERTFDAIFLDIKMPDLNGFGTAALIREGEKTRNIPIIFMTAHGENKELEALGYSYGAVDYIVKPFDSKELRSKIRNLVSLSRKTRSLELNIRETLALKGEQNILFVDDSPKNQVSMKAVLENLGYTLFSAGSREEAIIILQKKEFLLIFLNLHLPASGTREVARFRRESADISSIPILGVGSVKTASRNVSIGHSLGIADFVFTPFDSAILKAKITEVINGMKERTILKRQVTEIEHLTQKLALSEAKLRNLNETLGKKAEERTEALKTGFK